MKLAKIITLIFISSCAFDSPDDLVFNCENSDLRITMVDKIDPSCSESGSIEVFVEGGKMPYEYFINSEPENGNGIFDELGIGIYNISILDQNQCSKSIEVVLSSDEAIGFELIKEGCGNGDGTITVLANGGDGNYSFQLDNQDKTESNRFSNLNGGSYSITVFDGNDCSLTQSIKLGVSLDGDIMPIINTSCALNGCHLNNALIPIFDSRDIVIEYADEIKSLTTTGAMPKAGGPLSDDQLQLIIEWVDCGAQNN